MESYFKFWYKVLWLRKQIFAGNRSSTSACFYIWHLISCNLGFAISDNFFPAIYVFHISEHPHTKCSPYQTFLPPTFHLCALTWEPEDMKQHHLGAKPLIIQFLSNLFQNETFSRLIFGLKGKFLTCHDGGLCLFNRSLIPAQLPNPWRREN